ncbi:ABC transporter substrate-binding protein [Labrys monachus]|nr:ABC transporter substrate-binding protein [Labrys monachus]
MRFSALLSAVALFGLPSSGAFAGPTRYPLTLDNCGHAITFKQAPSRTVAIGQGSAEILYMLGLSDRMVGTARWIAPVLAEYEAVDAKIERLSKDNPSFEKVLSKKPDFITAQFLWQVGPKGEVAKREQFEELGIPVYISPSDCTGKNNAGVSDGSRVAAFSLDLIYREIRDLARIYDVQGRGEAAVTSLEARVVAARTKIAAASGQVSAVFWFSSPKDGDPYVAGRKGAPAYIMSVLGLRNVIEADDEWPNVGWETIAKADPTIIVAGKLDRQRFPLDAIEAKRRFLATDPVTSLMPAVRNGHVFELDAQAMNPTLRTIQGIEVVAEAIASAGLAR